MTILSDLAKKHNTDKQEWQHNYIPMYERMLKTIDVNSLLEIGLGGGASVRMWIDYFPDAKIYCVEYFGDENKVKWLGINGKIKGLTVFSGDSALEETWKDVPYDLDVIIDDGCHHQDVQIPTFLIAFNHLRSGGLYFIEDTHASMQTIFYQDGHCKLYDWLYNLIMKQQEAYDSTGNGGNFYASTYAMDDLVKSIYSYHIYKSVICLEKA